MLRPGQHFGRYVVQELVGSGGMGEIYRAHDTLLDRQVALKTLLVDARDPAPRAEAEARMLREARAAAALQHPNAVAIYDLGKVDDVPYLAMELVPGSNLRVYVGDELVPWERKLRWMVDVASALSAAHAAGLVHRDIKPENVVVRPDGRVTVLDFGIARRSAGAAGSGGGSSENTITGAGVVVGTLRYMAPEQMVARAVDGRADQFAWGVLTFELLSGAPPWPDVGDPLATAALILRQPAPSLQGAAPAVPATVARVVARALAARPDDRFASMDEVVAALEPLAAPVIPASVPSAPKISQQPVTPVVDPYGNTAIVEAPPRTLATERSPAPPSVARRRSRRIAVGVAVALAAIAATTFAVVWRHGAPALSSPEPVASSPPSTRAMSLLDLPRPTSTSPEAATLYQSAVQSLRDASEGLAATLLGQALARDPTLGAAHLRLALVSFFPSPVRPREHFLKASQLKAGMSDYDRALLDAVEPIFDRDPSDWAEADAHLVAAADRFPGDAELHYWLAWIRIQRGDLPGFAAASAEALRLDPGYTAVRELQISAAQLGGDVEGALRAAGACLEASPQAIRCLLRRARTLAQTGRCVEYEKDARRALAINPDDTWAYGALADSGLVLGRPVESVRELVRAKWQRTSPDERDYAEANEKFSLATLLGDGPGQDQAGREMIRSGASRTDDYYHVVPTYGLVELSTEMGALDRAASIADDFLRQRSAWTRDQSVDPWGIALDMEPRMLHALVRGHRMSVAAFEARRAEWLAGWRGRASPVTARYLWIYGYALVTDTPEEAAVALAALPAYEPVPEFIPSLLASADVGHAMLLGGRTEEALRWLRGAAASCNVSENPFAAVKASLWLGQALEQSGDRPGACDAYARVIARWGSLGARSVSAKLAGARRVALACAPR